MTVTTDVIRTPSKITNMLKKAIIKEKHRLDFLPAKFAKAENPMKEVNEFQDFVFMIANNLSDHYANHGHGHGYWDYVSLDENTFMLLYRDSTPMVSENTMNYANATLDSVLFSLIVNLMAFSHSCCFAFSQGEDKANELYHDYYHALYDWFYNNINAILAFDTDEEKQVAKEAQRIVAKFLD